MQVRDLKSEDWEQTILAKQSTSSHLIGWKRDFPLRLTLSWQSRVTKNPITAMWPHGGRGLKMENSSLQLGTYWDKLPRVPHSQGSPAGVHVSPATCCRYPKQRPPRTKQSTRFQESRSSEYQRLLKYMYLLKSWSSEAHVKQIIVLPRIRPFLPFCPG